MHHLGRIWLILVVCAINWTYSLPTKDSTTHRSQYGQTIKEISNQLMNVNETNMTFDTRTPPKVKQQIAKKENQILENSHPGVAVPVEDEELILDEGSKKFNFYKIENKPTTDGGISTWVLLNSQTVAPVVVTTKTPRRTTPKPKFEIKNITTTVETEPSTKVTKPLPKKRPSTTPQPPTSSKNPPVIIKEKSKPKLTALNVTISKNKTEQIKLIQQYLETAGNTSKNSSNGQNAKETLSVVSTVSEKENEVLQPEAKVGEIDLQSTNETSTKKPRRSSNKKKKNKKRRRPSIEKSDNDVTELVNTLTQKEKPIGTQIYNYLSREIMPTVGVGLVGLVVTAGLASYFLYPFGVARRSYEVVDRKDKEVSYQYTDEYAPGGVAEEEIIGKVIAGMPTHTKSYRSQNHKTIYSPLQQTPKPQTFEYKNVQPQATVEAVYLTPDQKYNTDGADMNVYGSPQRSNKPFYNINEPQSYNKDIIEYSPENGYTVEDKKFVVGNTPKSVIEEVTPVVVPEHGPRNLAEMVTTKDSLQSLTDIIPKSLSSAFLEHEPRTISRKRRSEENLENEILNRDEISEKLKDKNEIVSTTTQSGVESETEISVHNEPTFVSTLRDLIQFKIRIGLELLQNTTMALSRYISQVQSRFNKISNEEKNK